MAIEDLIQDATRRMHKSVEAAQGEFATLRTGRASPALLDRVQIDYYGQKTPLKQLATIGAPEPRMLTIQPFDPNSVSAIERAIQESDLGLTPSNDGKLIRLPIYVFALEEGNIRRVVHGERVGTIVSTP